MAVCKSAATRSGMASLALPPRNPVVGTSSQEQSPMRTHLRCTLGMECVQCVVSGNGPPMLASKWSDP
eukprot:11227588-Lingulodinium_polyedra.AAC.1